MPSLADQQWGPTGLKAQVANKRIADQKQPGQQQSGFNIKTGITPGPVYTPQQVAQGSGYYQQESQQPMPSMPGRQFSAPAAQGMQSHLNSIVGNQNMANNTEWKAKMAHMNAQNQFAGDRMQADMGLGWGNALSRDYLAQLANSAQYRNSLLGMLGTLIG